MCCVSDVQCVWCGKWNITEGISAMRTGVKDLLLGPDSIAITSCGTCFETLKDLLLHPDFGKTTSQFQNFCSIIQISSTRAILVFIFQWQVFYSTFRALPSGPSAQSSSLRAYWCTVIHNVRYIIHNSRCIACNECNWRQMIRKSPISFSYFRRFL